jgi:NADH-quinone oxidoreductase subunit H
MILLSTIATIMFLGGWSAPIDLDRMFEITTPEWLRALSDWFWMIAKVFFVVSLFIWFRASFPRYRYDQIMRLGWKIFIPLTLAWLVIVAIWMQTPWNIWSAPVRPNQGQATPVQQTVSLYPAATLAGAA